MSSEKLYYYTVTPTAVNQSEEIEVYYGAASGTVNLTQDLGVVCLNSENQINLYQQDIARRYRQFGANISSYPKYYRGIEK